jgi:hypothetical protein
MGIVKNFVANYPPTVKKFGSMREFNAYWDDHPEVADTVSPGGAAARLGVGRQRVYDLIAAGKLRAWLVYDCEVGGCYDVPGNRASYVFVYHPDIEAYAASSRKPGRPKKAAA